MHHAATVHVTLCHRRTYLNRCEPIWAATLMEVDEGDDPKLDAHGKPPVAYAGPNPGDAVTKLLDGFFDP